jgi:NADH-quinone oxidoreductase subunit N
MKAIIVLTIWAIITLFAGLFKVRKALLPLAFTGLALVLGMVLFYGCHCTDSMFGYVIDENRYLSMLDFNRYAAAFSGVMIASTLLIILLSGRGLNYHESHRPEHYGLMMFSLAGAMVLVSFNHMVMLFLGIEIMSIPLYVLAGSDKRSASSAEAAIKYYLMGAFATGIILFGIALMYGSSGQFSQAGIMHYAHAGHVSDMFKAGILFLLVGMCFKIGAVPFHFWSPDVYTGSPSIITSFMATVAKTAGIAALYRMFGTIIGNIPAWMDTLAIIAVASMFLGNLMAVIQTGFKRMMAYSSIAHVGYLLIAATSVVSVQSSNESLLLYMAAYSVASIASFGVLILIQQQRGGDSFSAFNGLGKTNMGVAIALTVAMISLAGIPPTAGFFSKYFLFTTGFEAHPWLIVAAIINSAISIYYYFKVVMAMWFQKEDGHAGSLEVPLAYRVVFIITTIGIFAIGLFPEAILHILKD